MGSIPLPALHLNPPAAPPNVMEQYGQLLQMKNAMANAPLQHQILQQQAQSGQMQLQQDRQGLQDQQAFRAAMSDPSMQGKTIGDVADALAQKGAISQQSWVAAKKADVEQRTQNAALTDTQLKNNKETNSQLQGMYNNAMEMKPEEFATAWPTLVQQISHIPGVQKMGLDPNQPMTQDQLSHIGPFLSMHAAYLDDEVAKRKAAAESKTAEATLSQKQAESQFYQQNGGAPGVSAELMQQSDWLKKNPGKGPSDYKAWVARQTPSAVVMNNQLGGDQNQQALDFAADNYRKTGQLPGGLYRSPGTITAIISRAAELDKQQGGAGIASNKATFQADEGSLKKLQASFDTVSAFEGTANKNIQMLEGIAQKVPDLGSRFANIPVRMFNGRMLGEENMAAFKTALAPVQAEAAKILNSANLQGTLSDSSRHELQDLVDGNLPYKSLVASLNVLQQDFKNRHDSMQVQIQDIQGRIKGGTAPTPQQNSSDPFAQFGGKAHP